MIRYERLNGVSIPGSASPVIQMTEEGKAIGHIPGWVLFTDPDYLIGDKGIRNRAKSNSVCVGTEVLVKSFFSSGASAITRSSDVSTNTMAKIPEQLPTTEFSWFGVYQAPLNTTSGVSFIRHIISTPEGGISLNVVRRAATSGIVVSARPTDTTFRAETRGGIFDLSDETPKLVMVTFSLEMGVKIFVNGRLEAENPTDTRPLNTGFLPNETVMGVGGAFAGTALQGMTGLLSIDLSKPEYSGYRLLIEKFMKEKYAIAN